MASKEFKLMKQGAEGKIYNGFYLGKPTIMKERFPKSYRHKDLDTQLTKDRIKAEARAILRCKMVGILTPCIYLVDFDRRRIYMEHFVNSITVKEFLYKVESNSDIDHSILKRLGTLIGTNLGKMHANNIIHGDLTTSNMLLVNKNNENVFNDLNNLNLSLIDFGLAHVESSAEDKGVDLYVLERAMLSTHQVTDIILPIIISSYKSTNKKGFDEVMRKFEEVRARGRKRTMVG